MMIVEASDQKSVIWTKPDDFEPGMADPAKGLAGLQPGGFLAAFADAHVQLIGAGVDAETLRNLFSRNDGNPVNLD